MAPGTVDAPCTKENISSRTVGWLGRERTGLVTCRDGSRRRSCIPWNARCAALRGFGRRTRGRLSARQTRGREPSWWRRLQKMLCSLFGR